MFSANATRSDIYFGLAANSVNSKSYQIDYGTYKVYLDVTADTCVPLIEDVIGTFGQCEYAKEPDYEILALVIVCEKLIINPCFCFDS